MKTNKFLKIAGVVCAGTVLLATTLSAQAAGPDWSLIISGPSVVLPPAPAQVAPVRPVVVAPPAAASAAIQGVVISNGRSDGRADNRGDGRGDNNWERDRDRQYQERFNERFQERESYWLEREKAFVAREKAFLERERQRQLVVENNQRASAAVNDRQEQQLDRIVDGVNKGLINKDEFVNLMAQQKNISNLERQYLSDGFLSQDEFGRLNAALDQASLSIRSERRDRRDRREPRERIYYPQNR